MSLPSLGTTSTRSVANWSSPFRGKRVPFSSSCPPAALSRRLCLLCPPCLQQSLALEHLFDPLQHPILGLKLGCLKLGEAGNELGSADVEAATRPIFAKLLAQEIHLVFLPSG